MLTPDQVAERLGVCVRTVYRHIASGELPAVKLGRRTVRIAETDVETYLLRHRVPVA